MKGWMVAAIMVSVALAGCTDAGSQGTDSVDCDERYAVTFPGYTHEGYKQDFESEGRAWFDEDGDCFHDDDEVELGTDPNDPDDYPTTRDGVDSTDPYEFLVEFTASVTSGDAPLTVQFEYGVPVGNSADVTWTLTIDDNTTIAEGTGDDLPGDASHGFNEAGEYAVTFHATDGTEESSRTIQISAAVPFICESVTPQGSFAANDDGVYAYNGEVWQESNGYDGLQTSDDQDCEPDTKVSP